MLLAERPVYEYPHPTMVERLIVGPLFTNAYIVSVGKKECIIIDPGAEGDKICDRLEVLNLQPQAILFTHGHIDHTAAAGRILEKYKADMPVGIHKADEGFLAASGEDTNRETFAVFGNQGAEAMTELYADTPKATFYLEDGKAILESDLIVIHTPGHTPGSISIYSEERKIVFSGDTLFFKGVGRTDIPGADREALEASIEKKLFSLPAETRLFPGHGPNSTIERERNNNPLTGDNQPI